MNKICSFCSRTYDYILRYEHLTMETQQFLKYLNLDHIIPPTVNFPEYLLIKSIRRSEFYLQFLKNSDVVCSTDKNSDRRWKIKGDSVFCIRQPQYDEPDLNKSWKPRPKTPTASKIIPLASRITIVWNPTNSSIS